MMNCEEFHRNGLDLDRADCDPAQAAEAAAHARICARCGGLLACWREAKEDLRRLREATRAEGAPPRVEMRLKQELRSKREARLPRRAALVAVWALAAAAVLAMGAGWKQRREQTARNRAAAPVESSSAVPGGMLQAADYDSGAFTRLPASVPSPYENQEILRVRMQRGALGRFGLPVAQDRAAEWVQVDFLIGEDGRPQAVRLHQELPEATLE